MKYIALLTLAGSFLFSCSADGQNWQKTRSVGSFKSIKVSSGIDLYLTQGNSESLKLEAKGVEENEVVSELKNGELILRINRGSNWGGLLNGRSVRAYVTVRTLEQLTASGGSDVYTEGTLKLNDLSVDLGGGSDAKMDLNARRISLNASGGSDADLKGEVAMLEAVASGGSDIDAKRLKAQVVRVKASGGSDAYVYATKEISADASGGSDVHYSGGAREVNMHKSGGSDLNRQ